jgi:hypothetical protein
MSLTVEKVVSRCKEYHGSMDPNTLIRPFYYSSKYNDYMCAIGCQLNNPKSGCLYGPISFIRGIQLKGKLEEPLFVKMQEDDDFYNFLNHLQHIHDYSYIVGEFVESLSEWERDNFSEQSALRIRTVLIAKNV